MLLYRKGSHTVFDLKYHIVWITKYRKPILTTKRALRVRELTAKYPLAHSVEITKGHVSKDHIHLSVSVPPQLSVSRLAQLLREKTSRRLLQGDKQLSKIYWGSHLWVTGYLEVSSGTITDESIME